jgi:predicted alpha/beta-hydrolase family hydrolase
VTSVHELRLALDDGTDVAATVHVPPAATVGRDGAARRAPVLLLPGARGDRDASHLVALAEQLSLAGHPVVRAALSSRPPGAGVVGPAERSVERLRSILRSVRRLPPAALDVARGAEEGSSDRSSSDSWVIGGASYGGRVASLALARHGAQELGVAGLLLIAYPLHPPGRPDRPRIAHWPDVDVPTLMLSGDADPFLSTALLERHAGDLAGPLTLLMVAGARHDLSVSSRSAPDGRRRTPAEVVGEHAGAVLLWLEGLPGKRAIGH